MTQYIYLASPIKLAGGSFGLHPISPENPNVFHTELDFTHLYFEGNDDSKINQRISYSSHFSYKHQVAASSNHLPLKGQIRGTKEEEKCFIILYTYIDEAIKNSRVIEYYTSISGQEDWPLTRKRSINWLDINNPRDLILDDREFIEFILW